jgi:hypothetical protein
VNDVATLAKPEAVSFTHGLALMKLSFPILSDLGGETAAAFAYDRGGRGAHPRR